LNYSELITQEFIACIESYLDTNTDGFQEYELLSHLNTQGCFDALDVEVSMTLLIFRKHFLLFHVLYSIHQQWVDDKQGALLITPLDIRRLDYVEADTQIGEVDALAGYYLNLDNLELSTEDNVNELLNSFWEMYLKYDKRADALRVLELKDPVTDKEIVVRYRQLASVHHPDKGGDHEEIQAINEAYAILIKK
jgi:hypothetical protein